jgi:membrane-associated protein
LEHLLALLLPQLPTLEEIVRWGGYIGLFLIVFSETGLLIGFFLPGDSMLVTAGLLIASGKVPLEIFWLCALLSIAAILGNTSGYWIGARAGKTLYNRPQSRLFRRDHLLKTREFYERYGGITIMIACFMPFARTFAPVVAGIAEMKYRRFILFNIAGAILWINSMLLIGYYLGRAIPGIERHIELLIIAIVAISVSPILVKYLQHKIKQKKSGSITIKD